MSKRPEESLAPCSWIDALRCQFASMSSLLGRYSVRLDNTDCEYILTMLHRAKSMFEYRMTDCSVCEANRERARENAKMTEKAIEIIRIAKERAREVTV